MDTIQRYQRLLAIIIAMLRQMISIKCLLLASCIGFTVSLFWVNAIDKQNCSTVNENLVHEALETVAKDSRYAEVYRKVSKLPKELKYMLLWDYHDFVPLSYFEKGQKGFIKKNCSMINCYVTTDRNFFDGDLTKFDAIAFNGRNIGRLKPSYLQKSRSPHQKYIFFNMESADNYPVCNRDLDGFFNWTSTYRLDSDIPYPYIQIRNNEGEVVGPKRNMDWIDYMGEIDEDLLYRLQNKSKAVAWFVSHCVSRSGRKEFVKKLQKALMPHKLTVDVYGSCGPLKCPKRKKSDCDTLLERDYFFYLSLENSFAEDYVTEKLLTALQHDIVPVVYGGADYTRFLPPGSYIDGRKHSPAELASIIVHLMSSPSEYRQFFKWKNYYNYHDPATVENMCSVCLALNNRTMMEMPTVYHKFRSWWNPNYQERCKK